MVDLVGEAGNLIGLGGGTGFDVGNIVLIFVGFIFFAIVAAAGTYYIVNRIQYKLKIIIFQRVDGRFKVTARDKAKIIKVGEAGDDAFVLRKFKKMIPSGNIQTGDRTYWYFISDDGEWINFSPGDFDEDRREMGSQFLDREMRYARTSLQQMTKERYNKPNFLEKYGGMIAYSILILVTCIGFFLIVDKMLDVAAASSSAVEASKGVLTETKRILGYIDTIQGGSGIVPAA